MSHFEACSNETREQTSHSVDVSLKTYSLESVIKRIAVQPLPDVHIRLQKDAHNTGTLNLSICLEPPESDSLSLSAAQSNVRLET